MGVSMMFCLAETTVGLHRPSGCGCGARAQCPAEANQRAAIVNLHFMVLVIPPSPVCENKAPGGPEVAEMQAHGAAEPGPGDAPWAEGEPEKGCPG